MIKSKYLSFPIQAWQNEFLDHTKSTKYNETWWNYQVYLFTWQNPHLFQKFVLVILWKICEAVQAVCNSGYFLNQKAAPLNCCTCTQMFYAINPKDNRAKYFIMVLHKLLKRLYSAVVSVLSGSFAIDFCRALKWSSSSEVKNLFSYFPALQIVVQSN